MANKDVYAPLTEEQRSAQFILEFRHIIKDPLVRKYLWHLMSCCGTFHDTFDEEGLVMACLSGHRKVGLKMLRDFMTAAPGTFADMLINPPVDPEPVEKEDEDNAE